MPVPASDAIASDVGHGALGLRYGLRPFRDLLSETVGQRHLWVELRPKKVLATWVSEGAGVYSKAVAETSDGIVLDVVGIQTLTEILARVESQATLSAGTFFYNGSTLYIFLTGSANPSGTTVVAELGIHVGSHGVYQPILYSEHLVGGVLDAWTGSTPDGWSVATGGTSATLDKTSTDPLQGTYAARITLDGSGAGYKRIYQSVGGSAGLMYRLSGAYRISGTDATSLHARVYVLVGVADFMLEDGRNLTAVETPFLDAVGDGTGEWRRFTLDFVLSAAASVWLKGEALAAKAGTVDFDDVKLQAISRYAYHEPLLTVDSLPTIEAARSDSFWGQMSTALGSLSLPNGGGRLEPLIAAYDWLGAAAIIRAGGRYQLGGNEVPFDDCPVIATGKLGAPVVTDGRVTFDLTDNRDILQRTLPPRTYNANGTDAYTDTDRGRSRPLLWGTKTGIRPVQYDVWNPDTGPVAMGLYEIVDCTDWSPGIKDLPNVYWYIDEAAALARNTALRVVVDPNVDLPIIELLSTGRFKVNNDVHPIIIDQENNKLHFDIGGATITATVTPGAYAMDAMNTNDLMGLLTTAMGNGVSSAWNAATQKVDFTKGAGTLNLRCATGADVQTGLWAVLGFNANADKTGALQYTADNVVVPLPAESQTLRVDAIGFKDDASGTYTGTASAAIEKAPDIVLHILRVFLGVPASAIDVASFVTCRGMQSASKPCSLYLGSPRTVADIFEELETSANMDIMLKDGVWSCVARDTTVPTGTPDLVDADYLSFEAHYDPEDLYGTVNLSYNESPDGGMPVPVRGPRARDPRVRLGEVTDATMALRFGRPDQRTFKTCLRDAADAVTNPARLQAIATEAQTKRRRFAFQTKGKALRVPVNGKIRLTRTRGLDTTGALANVLVRVISKRDDWARWVSEIEAIEVI